MPVEIAFNSLIPTVLESFESLTNDIFTPKSDRSLENDSPIQTKKKMAPLINKLNATMPEKMNNVLKANKKDRNRPSLPTKPNDEMMAFKDYAWRRQHHESLRVSKPVRNINISQRLTDLYHSRRNKFSSLAPN